MIESFWAQKFWFSIQGKPILYFKGLSFGYFSANRYATDRVTGCSVLFILFALVSSFADKNRSWFFAQRYQLIITTTTITRDAVFYGGNLFNITKMFSYYFQNTRESVTEFCGELRSTGLHTVCKLHCSSNSYVYSILTRRYIISRRPYELLHFMDVSQIAQVRYF